MPIFGFHRITIAIVLALLPSCAAMHGVGPFMLPVDSTPQGATVSYDGHDVGVTPCTVSVGNKVRKVELRLAGHHSRVAELDRKSNGKLVFLGFLLWGVFEIIVDAGAGAFYATNVDPILVPMVPDTEPAPDDWTRPVDTPEPPRRRAPWTTNR